MHLHSIWDKEQKYNMEWTKLVYNILHMKKTLCERDKLYVKYKLNPKSSKNKSNSVD